MMRWFSAEQGNEETEQLKKKKKAEIINYSFLPESWTLVSAFGYYNNCYFNLKDWIQMKDLEWISWLSTAFIHRAERFATKPQGTRFFTLQWLKSCTYAASNTTCCRVHSEPVYASPLML